MTPQGIVSWNSRWLQTVVQYGYFSCVRLEIHTAATPLHVMEGKGKRLA